MDDAVRRAKEAGVVVHTVGVGNRASASRSRTSTATATRDRLQEGRGRATVVVSRPHAETLEAIARGTGGSTRQPRPRTRAWRVSRPRSRAWSARRSRASGRTASASATRSCSASRWARSPSRCCCCRSAGVRARAAAAAAAVALVLGAPVLRRPPRGQCGGRGRRAPSRLTRQGRGRAPERQPPGGAPGLREGAPQSR